MENMLVIKQSKIFLFLTIIPTHAFSNSFKTFIKQTHECAEFCDILHLPGTYRDTKEKPGGFISGNVSHHRGIVIPHTQPHAVGTNANPIVSC